MKEAFNLNWESWNSADIETHHSTIHPEASGINDSGGLDKHGDSKLEQVRDMAKWMSENMEII